MTCKLCNKEHPKPFYKEDGFIIFEEATSRIVGYVDKHEKPTTEEFEQLRDLMLRAAKTRWKDYDFIHKTDTYKNHYSLILRDNASKQEVITDNVKDKFCPLLNTPCIGKKCLYYKEFTMKKDEYLFIERDCLARLEKEALIGDYEKKETR